MDREILKLIVTFRGFVENVIDIEPTIQQWDFIDEIDELIRCKIKKNVLMKELTESEAVYCSKLGITVMASRGVGKDSALSLFILWYLLVYPSKIPCTAPTGTQLSSILWSEIIKMHSLIKYGCIKALYIITNDKVRCSGSGFESFAIGRASGNTNGKGQKLSGYHSTNMAICIDEASGVEGVYEELELTLTSEVNFMILIWNPTKLDGYAYDSYYHPTLSSQWIKLHWDSYGSNIVSDESIERAKERYGENSNYFRVSVLGLPPKESTDSLIPVHLARWCMNRQYNEDTMFKPLKEIPLLIGIDPSRSAANGCDTICTVRQGSYIHEWYKPKEQSDSVVMCDEIIDKLFSRYPNFSYCFVETNGLGGPIFDILKRYDVDRIIGVDVSNKEVDEEFLNMRAQLWFRLRKHIIEKRLGINTNIERNDVETFISQITDIKQDNVSIQNSGKFKVKIESKKDMASRGVSSPDYGDATILSYYYTEEQLAQRLSIGKYKVERDAYTEDDDVDNWMV